MKESNNICSEFINGLKVKYLNSDETLRKKFNDFIEKKKGISKDELNDLIKEFPDVPTSLIELLKYSNGTDIFCFQSDVEDEKYPYYLVNAKTMLESKNIAKEYYKDYISREYDDIEIDNKITNDTEKVKWLLFSNCMNNGGTSQLFIDFTPSKEGKKGQVIRFLHDPDSIVVIANSFDEYLKQIIDTNYKFVDGEVETNEWLKSKTPAKVKPKNKNKSSLVGISIMGILSILFSIILFITSHFILGSIILLFGILLIIVLIGEVKANKK